MAIPSFSDASLDPEMIRAIVAEVVRRIRSEPPAAVSPMAAPSAGAETREGVVVPGRVVALAMLERLPPGVTRIVIEASAVITPSARDHARSRGLVIDRRSTGGGAVAPQSPFYVASAECGAEPAGQGAALARAVAGAAQLPASGLVDVVATLALHAARDAARGVLLCGRPAVAVVLANRSASLRAVTARDPAALAAAAADCSANLLVVDPSTFPAAALLRLATELAARPAGEIPAPLAARPAGCGCTGH